MNTFSTPPPEAPVAVPAKIIEELNHGHPPVACRISANDVRMLFVMNTSPDSYTQCILAALKDNGCPAVEGQLHLRLTHGKVARVKTDPAKEQAFFEYVWLDDAYVAAIANGAGGRA